VRVSSTVRGVTISRESLAYAERIILWSDELRAWAGPREIVSAGSVSVSASCCDATLAAAPACLAFLKSVNTRCS
jgi:hypothetical protein